MRSSDAISGLLFAALGIFAAVTARTFGLGSLAEPGAGFFPFWGSVLIIVCSSTIVALACVRAYRRTQPEPARNPTNWTKIALCVVVLFAYAAALPWLGFAISTFFVMLALSRFDPRTTWRGSLAIATLGALAFWIIFVRLLAVSFPAAKIGF